jgi:hypothetical protein
MKKDLLSEHLTLFANSTKMQHYDKGHFVKLETLGKILFIYFSQHSSRCRMQDKCNFLFQRTTFLDIWCLIFLNISVTIDQNI